MTELWVNKLESQKTIPTCGRFVEERGEERLGIEPVTFLFPFPQSYSTAHKICMSLETCLELVTLQQYQEQFCFKYKPTRQHQKITPVGINSTRPQTQSNR